MTQSIDTAGDVLKALFDLYYSLKSASSNLRIAVAGVEEAAKNAPEKYKRELQLYSDMLESAGDLVDAVRLALFDLKQHELHAKNREYEAATTHVETHLLNLINAVQNVADLENRLNEWF